MKNKIKKKMKKEKKEIKKRRKKNRRKTISTYNTLFKQFRIPQNWNCFGNKANSERVIGGHIP